MDIAEFLTARYGERESYAKRALNDPRSGTEGISVHIVDSELVDIAAKRKLLDWCAKVTAHLDWTAIDSFGWLQDDPNPRATHGCQLALRAMAAPYAAHPDYDPAWAVEA